MFLVGRDGNTRIWNVKTSEIIKTVLTPLPKINNKIYATIPTVHLLDNFDMLYILDKDVSLFM